jgi:hypothetical protein
MKKELINNISICSYNVFWKIMCLDKSLLNEKINLKTLKEFKQNLLKNIFLIKNYYNPHFYCFQESSSYEEILKIFENTKYDFHINYSEPEYMLTVWNNNLFKKQLIIDYEFEKGRPFSIFIFKDIFNKNYFILMNIHSGHRENTQKSIFEPMQQIIDNYKDEINKFTIYRIIVCGDFNRDINALINKNKFSLFLNKKKFIFKSLNTNNKTCCNLNGYGLKLNSDNIIDTFNQPRIVHPLNKESWYKLKSSDHIAILSILE